MLANIKSARYNEHKRARVEQWLYTDAKSKIKKRDKPDTQKNTTVSTHCQMAPEK